jgi:hypothetical protein
MARQRPPNRSNETDEPGEAAGRERYKRRLDELLDEALEETFPASDPIAVTPRRRKLPARPQAGAKSHGR